MKCQLLANIYIPQTEQVLWDTIKSPGIDPWRWYTGSNNLEAKRLCMESTRYNERTLDLPTKVNPGVSHCSTALRPPRNYQNNDIILDGSKSPGAMEGRKSEERIQSASEGPEVNNP